MQLIALAGLAAAGFTHWRLLRRGRKTASLILLCVGIGFGLATFIAYTNLPVLPAFLIGFAVVHLPALAIILIKAERHQQLGD